MQAILAAAADAIITLDRRGNIIDANPATERMFGYARAELFGKEIGLLMPPPFCEELDSAIFRLLRICEMREHGCSREMVGMRKDRTTFPIELTVSPVDHMQLFTAIIRDVSQRKALQKRVLDIADDERRRIGQDLHDGAGQELTGLSLFAGTLVELLERVPRSIVGGQVQFTLDEAQMQRLRETAGRLSCGLAQAHRHVQQLARGILPVQIEPGGLRSALDELARATDALPNVRCRFDCPFPIDVSSNSVATHLYRIAQEAVGNALRYSGCHEIDIALSKTPHEIVLQVSDDGTGFDIQHANRGGTDGKGGFGLGIMRYRAGIIGGVFELARRKEGGTLIKCTVPH